MAFDIKKLQDTQKSRLEAKREIFHLPEWVDGENDGNITIKPVTYSVISQYLKSKATVGEHQAGVYLIMNGVEGFNTIEHSRFLNGEATGTILKIVKEINRVSGIE